MSVGKAVCLVCGEPLVYFEEAQEVTCEICGRADTGHSICENGHYVCDACHRAKGVEHVMEVCAHSDSRNPIELAQELMRDKSIYPNGPEHHSLVGAVLLTCYKTCGGDIDLPAALAELKKRSLQVPGGTCGFWGCCGAATSAGQYYSIISGSTPMTKDPWAATARLTSRVIGRLADIGGPRCCKRTGFTAIEESAAYTAETLGIEMELPERTVCTFMARNAECRREECPFFPKKASDQA